MNSLLIYKSTFIQKLMFFLILMFIFYGFQRDQLKCEMNLNYWFYLIDDATFIDFEYIFMNAKAI